MTDPALEGVGVGRPATARQLVAVRRGWVSLPESERDSLVRLLGVLGIVLPRAQAVVLVRSAGEDRLRPLSFNQAHVLIDYLVTRGDGRAWESGQP